MQVPATFCLETSDINTWIWTDLNKKLSANKKQIELYHKSKNSLSSVYAAFSAEIDKCKFLYNALYV